MLLDPKDSLEGIFATVLIIAIEILVILLKDG